jgi:hypothetical protein
MRYVVGFVVLVALGISPLSATAQAGEEGATSESNLQEPALQLKLDAAGVDVAPSPLRTADGYTLEEMDVRVRRAKIGIGSSAAAFFVGGILVATGLGGECSWGGGAEREKCDRRAYAGTALAAGGAVGMIVSGILLGKRRQKLRRLQQAHYGPHRVQWDLAESRLAF